MGEGWTRERDARDDAGGRDERRASDASVDRTDADVGELEALISQATKAVDKAVGKGVLHKNTGARRKSRMSKYKQELRRDKGLLTA